MKKKNIPLSKVWSQIQAISSASTSWLMLAAIALTASTGLTSCASNSQAKGFNSPLRPPSPPEVATKPYILYTTGGPQIIGRPPPYQQQ